MGIAVLRHHDGRVTGWDHDRGTWAGRTRQASPIVRVVTWDYEDAGMMLTTGINRTGEASAPDQASSRRSEPARELPRLEKREAGASRRDAIADLMERNIERRELVGQGRLRHGRLGDHERIRFDD